MQLFNKLNVNILKIECKYKIDIDAILTLFENIDTLEIYSTNKKWLLDLMSSIPNLNKLIISGTFEKNIN